MPALVLAVMFDCLSQSGRNCMFHTSLRAFYFLLHLCYRASVCTQYSSMRRFRIAMVIISTLVKVQHIQNVLKGRNTLCVYVSDHCRETKQNFMVSMCSETEPMSCVRVEWIHSLSGCCCWHIGYWTSALCRSVVTNGGLILKWRRAHQWQQHHIMCGNMSLLFALKTSCY